MIFQEPLVSVIIPTTGKANIDLCKQALEEQTLKPYEVIVVQDFNQKGPARARNEGIARANGNLVALLDDDCIPPKNWLESLVAGVQKYDAHGAGGTYQETDSLLIDKRKRQKYPDVEQVDQTGVVGAGGNLMFRSAWLQEMQKQDGYIFNPSFKIAEDWEFIWRSKSRGAKLVYNPVRVKHLKKMTPFSYWCQQFGRGIGIAKLDQIQRSLGGNVVFPKSLIWGKEEENIIMKWLKVFWYKGIGPFDFKSFQSGKNFLVFWIGEKIQSLGFLFGKFVNRGSSFNE